MPDYALKASECPALVLPTVIDPTDATPSLLSALAAGDTTALLTKVNTGFAQTEFVGQSGGGLFAVRSGLELSDGGSLTLAVSAGKALITAGVVYDGGTLALTGGVYNWVWLLQNGTLTKTTQAGATPVPASPSSTCVFLGRVLTTGGAISAIDYSGRPSLLGGLPWRRTGDFGAPDDTPSAAVRFFSRSMSGVYFWDGIGWTALSGATTQVINASVSSLLSVVDDLEEQVEISGRKFRRLLYAYAGEVGLPCPHGLEDDLARACREAGDSTGELAS